MLGETFRRRCRFLSGNGRIFHELNGGNTFVIKKNWKIDFSFYLCQNNQHEDRQYPKQPSLRLLQIHISTTNPVPTTTSQPKPANLVMFETMNYWVAPSALKTHIHGGQLTGLFHHDHGLYHIRVDHLEPNTKSVG